MKIDKSIDYYSVLELVPDNISSDIENYRAKRDKHLKTLNFKDIKLAFRKLSKQHHPDKTNGDDTMFKKITEAYKVLSDETLREDYDLKSEYGLNYDFTTELYEFEFSNSNKYSDNLNKRFDKFKSKELIDILIVLDSFQEILEYERYVTCKMCDGNGFDPANVDAYDCDICDGEGEDRFGKKCSFCNGNGKNIMGFGKCPTCVGEKVISKPEKIKLNISKFKDGKCILDYLGNSSKTDIGKVGKLYIKIKDE